MNVTGLPTYVTSAEVDALIVAGESIDPEYQCRTCGAMGWGWVVTPIGETRKLCPCCGENEGDRIRECE